MSQVQQLTIAGINIIESDGTINWSRFKNTPPSIISVTGHNHDALYYLSTETNAKFTDVENTLYNIQMQINALALKYTSYIGGGNNGGNSINKYTTSTEMMVTLGTFLSHSPLNAPGLTSRSHGYIFNTDKTTTKFTHSTTTVQNISTSLKVPVGTLYDYAIQRKGFITDDKNGWAALDPLTDIWATLNDAPSNANGRPLLSGSIEGYTKTTGNGTSYKYDYIKGTSSETISFNIVGIPAGMVRNSSSGYWVANTNSIYRHNYTSNSVAKIPSFTNHFSNTNTISTEYHGYLISGSNHEHIQKINWVTEAVSTAGTFDDLTGGSCIEF